MSALWWTLGTVVVVCLLLVLVGGFLFGCSVIAALMGKRGKA